MMVSLCKNLPVKNTEGMLRIGDVEKNCEGRGRDCWLKSDLKKEAKAKGMRVISKTSKEEMCEYLLAKQKEEKKGEVKVSPPKVEVKSPPKEKPEEKKRKLFLPLPAKPFLPFGGLFPLKDEEMKFPDFSKDLTLRGESRSFNLGKVIPALQLLLKQKVSSKGRKLLYPEDSLVNIKVKSQEGNGVIKLAFSSNFKPDIYAAKAALAERCISLVTIEESKGDREAIILVINPKRKNYLSVSTIPNRHHLNKILGELGSTAELRNYRNVTTEEIYSKAATIVPESWRKEVSRFVGMALISYGFLLNPRRNPDEVIGPLFSHGWLNHGNLQYFSNLINDQVEDIFPDALM